MCGVIWTRKQWIDATNNLVDGYNDMYNLVATFTNSDGEVALMIQDTDDLPFVHNIYDDEGDYEDFAAYSEEEGLAALVDATETMHMRGYTNSFNFVVEKVEPVTVQGLTLEQWTTAGKLNDAFDGHEHLHPNLPEDKNEWSEDEVQAFANSLTRDEASVEAISVLLDIVDLIEEQMVMRQLERMLQEAPTLPWSAVQKLLV